MILIESIKYFEVDRDPYTLIAQEPFGCVPLMTDEGAEYKPMDALTEFVSGRRFCRPSDGTDIVIGMSKDVRDLIGIQYEAYENLEKELSDWINSNGRLAEKINKAENAGFWQRLKWLFSGINLTKH
jgi:hypothetical protein